MFEQEYEKEAAELKTESGDLFHNYEIKNWELDARIYKIIAASAVLNVVAIFAFGQPRLLTRGACESPFVGRICAVLDTVYVGSVLFGTEREYVDKEYDKTELGDAEEIIWIDQTGIEPQFAYPEGYFYKDPALVAQSTFDTSTSGFLAPGIPSNPTISSPLVNTPQILKPAKPGIIRGEDSGSLISTEGDDGENPTVANNVNRKGNRGGRVNPNGNTNTTVANANTTEPPKVDPLAPVKGVQINRQPMRDFAQNVIVKLDKREVDLTRNFKVTANAVLTEDGKIDVTVDEKTKLPKSRVLTADGDPEMIKVVTEAIAAIGDSGWLGYLTEEGIKNIKFTFSQDDEALVVDIVSENLTPARAKKVSNAIANSISLAFVADSTGLKKLGDDEKALLKAATATSKGKQVLINFKLPKIDAQDMINRNIQRTRDAAGKTPSGQTNGPSAANSTAAK